LVAPTETKAARTFCPGWRHQRGQKASLLSRSKQPPGTKEATGLSLPIFSKSLAPLLSFLSLSSLSLPYLLPPAPFLSGAAPSFSPHSLRQGPARAGVRRAAAGPWALAWVARAGARRAAGGAAMRRRWQLGFGRRSQAPAGGATRPRRGRRGQDRRAAGGAAMRRRGQLGQAPAGGATRPRRGRRSQGQRAAAQRGPGKRCGPASR